MICGIEAMEMAAPFSGISTSCGFRSSVLNRAVAMTGNCIWLDGGSMGVVC